MTQMGEELPLKCTRRNHSTRHEAWCSHESLRPLLHCRSPFTGHRSRMNGERWTVNDPLRHCQSRLFGKTAQIIKKHQIKRTHTYKKQRIKTYDKVWEITNVHVFSCSFFDTSKNAWFWKESYQIYIRWKGFETSNSNITSVTMFGLITSEKRLLKQFIPRSRERD